MITERLKGFTDTYNPSDDECDRDEFLRRMELCSACEHRRDVKCLRCDCLGKLITRVARKPEKHCPVGRW